MASTRLGYLAVEKETTRAVPVKPTNFIRFTEGNIEHSQELIENNPIQNTRWNSITPVQGKIETNGSFKLDADTREMGHFLLAGLGDVATTNSGSLKLHTFTTANRLPSLTLEQLQGNSQGDDYVMSRSFGVMVDQLELSASDGLVEMNVDMKATGMFFKSNLLNAETAGTGVSIELGSTEGILATDSVVITNTTGEKETATVSAVTASAITATIASSYLADSKVELAPQTPAYTNPQSIFSFVHAKFQFGTDLTAAASATEENVENWTFTYMNNLEERYGSLRATPSVIAEKGAGATLKYTKFFETRVDRDRYLDQTRQACILTLELPGANAHSLKIEMQDLRFTSYKMDTGADDVYVAEMEASCFYDQTSGQAIAIKLLNDVTSY